MVIVLENRNPSKTLAWLIVLTFLPIVGFFFYLVFGQNIRKKKRFRRKELADFGELQQVAEKQLELWNRNLSYRGMSTGAAW